MSSAPTMKRLTDRSFGLALGAIFALIAAVAWLVFDLFPIWALSLAAFFGLTALTLPWILLPLNRLWHALAYPLGQGMNYLILGIFFFICMVPIGFVMRLFGWDPMGRATRASYWVEVRRRTGAETLRDMF